jgi:flagellin
MALGVLNNISAISAQNNLSNTQASLSKTLQQLSSGSRINSGADDAAGLSLANGLQASSTALTQSAANASEGVDFLQVADGALSQVTSLLNRAITLATEAGNGTLNSSQTAAANSEYQKILTEVNTINNTTEYNGINTFETQSTASVGGASDVISTGSSTNGVLTLSYTDSTGTAQSATFASAGSIGAGSANVTVLKAGATVNDLATAINNKMGSSVASVQNNQLILTGGDKLAGTLTETNAINTTNAGTANAVGTVSVGNPSDTFISPTVFGGTVAAALTSGTLATLQGAGGANSNTDLFGTTFAVGDYVMTTTDKTGATQYIDLGSASSNSALVAATAAYVTATGDTSGSAITGSGALSGAGVAGVVANKDSFGNSEVVANKVFTIGTQTIVSGKQEALSVQVGNGAAAQISFAAGGKLDDLVAAINTAAGSNVASVQGNSMVLTGATLTGAITESEAANGSASNRAAVSIFTSDGTIATSYNNTAADQVKADSSALGLSNSSLATAAGSQSALTTINIAITEVAADRGTLGANINTLTAVENVMSTQSTNTLSAENDVTATDYGTATSKMSQEQILMQTGIAALSQANQTQQLITKLLQ